MGFFVVHIIMKKLSIRLRKGRLHIKIYNEKHRIIFPLTTLPDLPSWVIETREDGIQILCR